jgi:predicted phage-related endonuclease
MLTDAEIITRHRTRWAQLVAQYGDSHAIPAQKAALAHERLRAEHVAQIAISRNLGHQLPRFLADYGVYSSVIEELTGTQPDVERKVKRADKYQAINAWCADNPGKTTTVAEVAEVGGFSLSTANQLIKDRIDLFRRLKRGEYLIRNPAAERAEEK